jgi:hypothetical protein
MNINTLLGALALSIATGAAHGAVLTTSHTAAGNVVTDYSSAGLVSFDLDLAQLRNSTLTFTLEAADLAAPTLSFNALVRNLSGAGLHSFGFQLQGISFAGDEGSVTPAFGSVSNLIADSTGVRVDFGAPEYAELHFGNPTSAAGKFDWTFSTAGLQAGDTFTITSAVPEPGNVALMLAGLGVFGLMRRRKQG